MFFSDMSKGSGEDPRISVARVIALTSQIAGKGVIARIAPVTALIVNPVSVR